MSARPEFLAYSPADIVAMGRERGADADAIARAVNTHRSNLEAYGRENHPDTYWDATGKLDRDSQEALDSVRTNEQQRLLQERLDPAQQQEFTTALEAAAYDPEKIDPTWQPMATELAAQSDRFRLPAHRIHGGKITVGDTALARYSMRESGDGMMDARIEFDDGSSGLERIAKASDDDVKAEIAREEQRRQALLTDAEQAKGTAPWLPVVQDADLWEKQAQDAQTRIDRLKAGGVRALMGERVTDALKTGKLKDKVGQYALGQDFLKGLVGASLDAGIMVNRFAGSQADMDELLAAKQEMDAALPGSTRPGFDGSLLGSAVRDASGSAGAMLPGMIGGGSAKLLANATELAAINAGKTGAMGAIMAAQGYGAGYAESEQEARAAEAAGDVTKAQRIRSLREVHALMSAGIDAMTERIGDLNLIKSPGRGMKAVGSIAKEGLVEEGLAQAAKDVALNPITLERQATLDNVPGAMLAGSLAAVPLAGVGAVMGRRDQRFANVNARNASPETAGPYPAHDGEDVAGSTPAVGAAFNPGDVHPVTGKTVEAVFTGANGAREIAYTDGTSETVAPTVAQPDNREVSDPAQDAAAEAALASGPKSLMDVATRAGKVDSRATLQAAEAAIKNAPPEQRAAAVQAANQAEAEIIARAAAPQPGGRLQFSKKSTASSYDEVRNGHPVRSIKQHIPRAPDVMPRIADEQLNEAAATQAVGQMIEQTPVITDAQGKRVLLANPDGPRGSKRTIAQRIAHLLGSHAKEDYHKTGPRFFKPDKAATALAVPTTVVDYHIKAHDPKTRQTLYLRRYADGKVHAVITDRESRVTDFGEVQGGLTTQRSPKPIEAFDGFFVEDKRTPATGLPSRDTMQVSQTQEATRTPPPRGQTTPRVQESKRFVPGVPLNQRVTNTRAVAEQAARILNQQLPGIVGPKLTFFASPAELLASNYAAENSFSAEEQAQMQDAEAFFDNDTGHTIVFTDAIEVRPGESDRAAVARVILHERVGHDGFNALHQHEAKFRESWDRLSAKIPSPELDALARDYPHLAGDKHQLALEWFARAVEQRLHLKEGNLAQRLWVALKGLYQRLFEPFAKSLTAESDLRALINQARAAAQNGTAVPTTAEGLRHRLQFTGDAPQRDDLDLGEAVAQIEAFYADPVETDYWPTDLAKKWEDDPLRVAVEDDGDFLAAVPHLPEALRNSPQVQAWAAAYQRYDELQRKSLNTPLTAAEADESDALEDPTNKALDWLDSPDVQSALASRKSALETAVEARAAQTIQQIESTGRYKWNRKSKSFDYVDDSDIRVQFSLAKQGAAPQAARHDSRQHTSLGAMPGVSPQQQSESVKRRVMGAVNAARITFARFGTPITEARTEAEAKALGIDDDHWIGVGPRGLVFVPHRAPERLTDRFADAAVQEEVIHIGWMRALDEQAKAKGIPYQHHVTAQMGAMLRELDASPTGQRAFMEAANLYDRVNARSRGAYRNYQEARAAYQGREHYLISELARQLIQLRTQADTTESAFRKALGIIQKWLKAALDQLRQVAADPAAASPTLEAAIRETEAILNDKSRSWRTMVPATGMQYAMGGTRVRHTPGQPFRVNDLATRTILTGSALPRAFHEAVQSTERERRACDQAAAQIGRDLNAAIESHATRTGTPLAQVYDMVHQAMSGAPGTNAVLLQVDPVLAERARVARNFIDDLSVAIAQTLPRGPLRNNIILNQGAWLRRSFATFDPASNWHFDNVMQAARAGEQLGGRPARDIVRAAARFLRVQNAYPAGMITAQGMPVPGSVLESDMRDLMDRDTFANALSGSAAVRKNVSSLITRQDIPAELRALMGEDTNPIKRFANSAAFQVQFIQRHSQQQTLRTIGLGAGLFATARGGVNVTEIPENHRWSPLAGLWTTPQLWEALQRVDGTERGNDFWSKMGEAVKWLGSEAKLNRVAMNPDSWLVNAAGNVVALAQTGDLFSTTFFSRVAQAVGLMRAGQAKAGDVVNATTEAITDANRAMIARLNAAGVLGETFSARDLEASLPRHLLQWIDQDASGLRDRALGAAKGALYGQASGRGLGLTGRAVGAVVGAAAGATAGHQRLLGWQQALASYVMTGPDALGRLTGFLGNLETAHTAGLTGDAAFRHAAERTRNTFPDYSKLPATLRSLSKYGLAGSFVAFQYEVYRNTTWNLRYALQDLRSGNAALQTRGGKRLLGAMMIGYLAAGGLQALFQNAAGTDDDRNDRWRKWFAAPWERRAVLAFTDYTEKSVSYFNTSYLIPQTTIAELVKAARDGNDPAEAAGNLLGQVWEQFMGSSVHIAPLMQAATNTDRMGRPITYKEGVAGALERADYVTQVTLEPGWTAKIERLQYALREAERRGRTFSVQEEMERFIGIRKFTRTWSDMVKRRYDGFAHDYSAIRSEANKAIGTNLPGAKAAAIATANAKIAALAQELTEYDADLPTLGVPATLIDTARRDSTVPKTFRPLEIDPDTGNRVRSVKN